MVFTLKLFSFCLWVRRFQCRIHQMDTTFIVGKKTNNLPSQPLPPLPKTLQTTPKIHCAKKLLLLLLAKELLLVAKEL